jgi:hypothetical protein
MEGSSDNGVFDPVGRRSAFRAKSRWLPALDVAEKDGVVGVVSAVQLYLVRVRVGSQFVALELGKPVSVPIR